MFTLEQVKEAHSKVKSGADFPSYIQEIKKLGVRSYEFFLSDGHTDYYGDSGFTLSGIPNWEGVAIESNGQKEKLEAEIKIHQAGGTDYPTFCKLAAEAGVKKWVVDMEKMMCTYYDEAGVDLLAEAIPDANAYAH